MTHEFTVPDYVVFSLTIAISLGIGVYTALTGGRQRTTQEFLVGNRQMKVLPVTLSLIVSFESSIMMLGYPAEMYTHGAQYMWMALVWCLSMIVIAYLMVPTFYDMGIISAYEYLQARFDSRVVRSTGAFLGAMTNLWYMGIVLYGPATALEAVTGFATWNSIIVIALVAMIYTTIGGIKAVIWADAFQAFVMLAGMLAVIIQGTLRVGGASRTFDIIKKGGRFNLFAFDVDPTVRMTFWGLIIGGSLRTFNVGVNQTSIQRISTMPTKKKAIQITAISGFGFFVSGMLAFVEGLVAYAYFSSIDCDPLESGLVENPNQIIPYMVMELFSGLPGLPGIFLAALFSASLSTLSSGYASISAIVWSDFIKPHVPNASEFKATMIAKGLVVVSGVLSIGIAILVMQVGGPLNEMAGTLVASFSGPLAGLFLLGGIVPRANAKGALAAVVVSSTVTIWKAMGSMFSPDVVGTPYLPGSSVLNCSQGNVSVMSIIDPFPNITTLLHATTSPVRYRSGLTAFYEISFMWLSLIAFVITFVVGLIVSYATGARKKSEINPVHQMPICERLCCCLPEKLRAVFAHKSYLMEERRLKTDTDEMATLKIGTTDEEWPSDVTTNNRDVI